MSKFRKRSLTAAAVLSGLLSVADLSLSSDDFIEAGKLSDSGYILPLEVILEQLRETNPGRILEVELGQENSMSIYEIELLDGTGQVWEFSVDAVSGAILQTRPED